MMHDEKGKDEKIFVVPVDEIDEYNKKTELEIQLMQNDIVWFFSNYKLREEGKWSRVDYIMDKKQSVSAYRSSVRNFVEKSLDTLQKSM